MTHLPVTTGKVRSLPMNPKTQGGRADKAFVLGGEQGARGKFHFLMPPLVSAVTSCLGQQRWEDPGKKVPCGGLGQGVGKQDCNFIRL